MTARDGAMAMLGRNRAFRRDFFDFKRADPGDPLGVGMPSGSPLRLDGESHRDAYKRLVKSDPCSYCDAPKSGTVDHILPRSKAAPSEAHVWLNYAGSCSACNESKRDLPLLVWLARRGVLRRSP